MKHNNVIPNAHFHKDWERYVKEWHNQPAKKLRRRLRREARARRVAPRPLDLLRPISRGQTKKYNMKIRAGRGFTLDELKAARIRRKEALSIGIAIDLRRKNRSQESFQQNVGRLREYRSKLILFPRKSSEKRRKKGEATKVQRKQAKQVDLADVLPISQPVFPIEIRKIRESERNKHVVQVARNKWLDARLKGKRDKAAKDKKEGKSLVKKQKPSEEENLEE